MNTPGKEIASAVNGKYRKSVISLMVSLDKVMKVIFDEEGARRTGQPRWFTETCFFLVVTYFPVVLFPDVPLSVLIIGFPVLVLVNVLRYEVIRLSN